MTAPVTPLVRALADLEPVLHDLRSAAAAVYSITTERPGWTDDPEENGLIWCASTCHDLAVDAFKRYEALFHLVHGTKAEAEEGTP